MGEKQKSKRSRKRSWVIWGSLGAAAGIVWLIRRRQHHRYHPLTRRSADAEPRPAVESRPTEPVAKPATQPEMKKPPEAEVPPRPKPTTWQEVEPTDPTDPVPHMTHRLLEGVDGWRLAGASRRGKMHAHHGTYREDAFAMDVVGPWHLVAVSDGAGSSRLSRVGSRLAVETAVARMKEIVQTEPNLSPEKLRRALAEALLAAHEAVQQEAKQRGLPVKEFSATLLLLVHGVGRDSHVIGSIQVGDGLIAIKYRDGTIEPLAERDSGIHGGETYFLTSQPVEVWLERGKVRLLEEPPELLVAMSDGVADDFIPYKRHLPVLFGTLEKVTAREEGFRDGDEDQVLLQLIGYDKRGSFDDRTLVMLCRKQS